MSYTRYNITFTQEETPNDLDVTDDGYTSWLSASNGHTGNHADSYESCPEMEDLEDNYYSSYAENSSCGISDTNAQPEPAWTETPSGYVRWSRANIENTVETQEVQPAPGAVDRFMESLSVRELSILQRIAGLLRS
jgi:hypothetical protein